MDDPYQILGLRQRATQADIKNAFRRLARDHHPDRHPDKPEIEDSFKRLSAAYDLLSDPQTRARYDRGEIDANGNRRVHAQKARTGGRGPFDNIFRKRQGRGAGIKVKGADVTYLLKIDLVSAAQGVSKRIATANSRTLEVKVPAGTRTGQILRLKGQGMGGMGGGADGDALVEIKIEPHPLFVADGDDIRSELAVSLVEAVLGGKAEVPTIQGPVSVSVPAGSNSGTRLRLKGKGLAKPGGSGDQYVTLKVMLPAKPDGELTEFIRKWAAAHPYDARPRKADTDG